MLKPKFTASLVAYFLSGCATAYGPEPVVGWSVDTGCEAPSQLDLDAITGGTGLWADFGVIVAPDAPGATVHVTFCFVAGPAVEVDGALYRGFTACEGNRCTTRINHLETVPGTYPALVAHEVAHALGIDAHLPPGVPGIMTADAIVCDGPCGWSAADSELLEEAGFSPSVSRKELD